MYSTLTIRVNKIKDLVLIRNIEKVYFIFQHGKSIFNSLDYGLVSDKFNELINK